MALDGKIRITHAIAQDTLSPPVIYDLYVISDQVAASVLQADGVSVRADALVFEDIPPVFDLQWPNRVEAHLLVRARDSAPISNSDNNKKVVSRAPGRYIRSILDPRIPGIYAEIERIWGDNALDGNRQKAYFCYTTSGDAPLDRKQLWFIGVDLKSATWQSKLLYTAPEGQKIDSSPKVAVSRTGDVWVRGAISLTSGSTFYKVLRTNGQWQDWDAEQPAYAWYNESFDHNGNPLTIVLETSDIKPDRKKVIYKWWDAETSDWVEEIAVDPGSTECYTFTKLDGTLQLIVDGESGPNGGSPKQSRIVERSAAGSWSQVIAQSGTIWTPMEEIDVVWGGDVDWWGIANISGIGKHLLYGHTGYSFVDAPLIDGTVISGRYWPADQAHFHLLPTYLWQDQAYFKQSFTSMNYAEDIVQRNLLNLIQDEFRASPIYNLQSGEYSLLEVEPDLTSNDFSWVILKAQSGDSILRAE